MHYYCVITGIFRSPQIGNTPLTSYLYMPNLNVILKVFWRIIDGNKSGIMTPLNGKAIPISRNVDMESKNLSRNYMIA